MEFSLFFLFFEYIFKYSQEKKHLFLEIKNQFLSKYDDSDKTNQTNKNKFSKQRLEAFFWNFCSRPFLNSSYNCNLLVETLLIGVPNDEIL